jgi:hypothetical protein
MSDFITGIEINENTADSYFTFKITHLIWDEEDNSWGNRTILSRQYSHYDDVVEAVHDNLMRWERDNKHVKNWDEKDAEERFNRTDYYEGSNK